MSIGVPAVSAYTVQNWSGPTVPLSSSQADGPAAIVVGRDVAVVAVDAEVVGGVVTASEEAAGELVLPHAAVAAAATTAAPTSGISMRRVIMARTKNRNSSRHRC